ncbi:MAG: VCBS repeat-containing protein, partial [Acidobacteriaceae bacterium]
IAAAMAYGASAAPVYVLWNNGTGTFTQDELGTYTQPMVKMTRLNGDNLMDVLVGYTCDPTMNGGGGKGSEYNPCAGFDVYYGQGGNSLYKRTVVTDPDVYGPGTYEGLEEWGTDVNGDGYGDIVASTGSSCWCQFGLFVWQGNADGSFQQTAQEFISNTDSAGPVAAADFNRDGMMDFVVDQGSDEDAEIYLNATNRASCGTYTISPSVTVCQPVDDTYSPSPVTVQATSYDTTQVTAMQEYVDNQLEYSEPVTSFNTTFAESLGPHSFVTKGWDSSGRSFIADRTVTVYSGTPGPVCAAAPESASICVPSGTSSPVEIVANGDSGSVVPTAAQLYINGSLVVNNEGYCYQNGNCAGGTSSVQTTQNLASGSYTLLFKLWDANGDVYTAQKTITVE